MTPNLKDISQQDNLLFGKRSGIDQNPKTPFQKLIASSNDQLPNKRPVDNKIAKLVPNQPQYYNSLTASLSLDTPYSKQG